MSVLERCPSYRESKKRSKERQGPTLKCPFYRGVRLIEVSVKREWTVLTHSKTDTYETGTLCPSERDVLLTNCQ